MSAVSIVLAPTSNGVGRSTFPTTYPAGIAARIPMMSCSRLSRDAGFELYATMAVIVKFTLTLMVALFINCCSRYGDDGTMTIAGGIGDSGTYP